MNIFAEIYKFFFISSIIFMVYILSNLIIKIYGRFKLNKDTKFILTSVEKIILWISLSIFFSYIIK